MASSAKSRLVRWQPGWWLMHHECHCSPSFMNQQVHGARQAIERAQSSSLVEYRLKPKKD